MSNINDSLELTNIKQIIDVTLMTATDSLSVNQIALAFDKQIDNNLIEKIILNLAQEYTERGLELLRLNNGYRVRSRIEFQPYLNKIYQVKPPRYSRAVLETVTIIAYRQPITRSEIEEIRGVTVNGNVIQTLIERGWIEVIGNKEAPGRPELLATTNKFLDELAISSLQELPPLPNVDKNTIEVKNN